MSICTSTIFIPNADSCIKAGRSKVHPTWRPIHWKYKQIECKCVTATIQFKLQRVNKMFFINVYAAQCSAHVIILTWSDCPLMSIFKDCLAYPLISLFSPKTNVFDTNKDKPKRRKSNNNKSFKSWTKCLTFPLGTL